MERHTAFVIHRCDTYVLCCLLDPSVWYLCTLLSVRSIGVIRLSYDVQGPSIWCIHHVVCRIHWCDTFIEWDTSVVKMIHQCETFIEWRAWFSGVMHLCGVQDPSWHGCDTKECRSTATRFGDTFVLWCTGSMGVIHLSRGIQDVLLKEEETPGDERIDGIGMGTHNLLQCKCLRSLILFIWSN